MGAYVYSLVTGALLVGLICAISPDGEGGSLGKYVAFAGALMLALIMLSPLADILLGNEEIPLPSVQTGETDRVNTSEYYASSAGMALSSIYSTDISKIKTRVHYDKGADRVERIELLVNERVYYDTSEAGETLSEIFGFEIKVTEVLE